MSKSGRGGDSWGGFASRHDSVDLLEAPKIFTRPIDGPSQFCDSHIHGHGNQAGPDGQGGPKEMTNWTHEQAIAALTDRDVAKWGEAERTAAERLNRKNYPTLGLALNRLAHYDPTAIDRELAAEAKKLMTAADQRLLRTGG